MREARTMPPTPMTVRPEASTAGEGSAGARQEGSQQSPDNPFALNSRGGFGRGLEHELDNRFGRRAARLAYGRASSRFPSRPRDRNGGGRRVRLAVLSRLA